MHVIELFLPIADNEHQRFDQSKFDRVRKSLLERFGGVTMFARNPIEGEWKPAGEAKSKDELIIFEVMAKELDAPWWAAFRKELEGVFRQESIICRASKIELL